MKNCKQEITFSRCNRSDPFKRFFATLKMKSSICFFKDFSLIIQKKTSGAV